MSLIEKKQINDTTIRWTVPFWTKHNDQIEIYVITQSNGTYYITDDGDTLSELQLDGVDIYEETVEKKLDMIISANGVNRLRNELVIVCEEKELWFKPYELICCCEKLLTIDFISC